MEVEDLCNLRFHEVVTQGRCLSSAPLAVVGATHRVRPAVAVSDTEAHLVLGEHLLERLTVDAACIDQRFRDLVAEDLFKAAVLERAATQIPVSLRLLRRRQHPAPLVPHEFIVDLAESTRPRTTPRQCLAGQVVMINDVDVVMEMPTGTVGVCNDEVVGAVHASSELYTKLMHTLHVLGVVHVELLGREVLGVGVHLVAAMKRRAHLLRIPHDLLGRVERAREQRGTCRAVLLVLHTPLARAEQRVGNRCSCAGGRLHIDGAHRLTSSPSSERTSATAARTSRKMSSSTALPARTT